MPKKITSVDLKNARRLASDSAPHVYQTDKKTVVKVGDACRLSEAATMKFVRSRTSIPVPEVYDAYMDENEPGRGFLLMEYVEGEVLRDVWAGMTSDWKESVVLQLKGYLDELRAFQAESIGPLDGSACEDQLFDRVIGLTYGPYDTEAAFNKGIVRAMKASRQNILVDMVADMVRAMPAHEIVLTHSDLAPRNILVHDAKVVAILDWELAGYYLAYWEYVKALYLPDWDDEWIKERVVDRIMKPYHLEHAVMRQVRDVFWERAQKAFDEPRPCETWRLNYSILCNVYVTFLLSFT